MARVEVGNDRPTLRYLEQGTRIIPHDEVNQYIMNRMMQNTAKALMVEDSKTDEIKEAILWSTKETIKALKKSKRTSVNIHLDSNFGSYIKKQVFE
jgi:microcompartment protein CcmL/EutN